MRNGNYAYSFLFNSLKPSQLLIIFLFCQAYVFSQTNKFSWAFDCVYEGTFETDKFTEAQLRDTYTLCFTNISLLKYNSVAWNPGEIDKLSVDSLYKEYKYRLNKIKGLKIVNLPFWKQMKKDQIKYLKNFYEMARVSILSYKKPAILKQYTAAGSCEYADAIIEGGEKMFSTWEKLAKIQCKTNGDTAKCFKDIYSDKFNSPQKTIYGQIEIMLWGWWNICAIRTLPRLMPGIEIHEEFKKLFTEIKNLGCDEGG